MKCLTLARFSSQMISLFQEGDVYTMVYFNVFQARNLYHSNKHSGNDIKDDNILMGCTHFLSLVS